MKNKLINGEMLTFIKGDDVFQTWYSNSSKRFCIEINGACIATYINFSSFLNKLSKLGVI